MEFVSTAIHYKLGPMEGSYGKILWKVQLVCSRKLVSLVHCIVGSIGSEKKVTVFIFRMSIE